MRIRNATRRCLVLFATVAVLFSGCGKSKADAETETASESKQESKSEMLEIFIDKDGRIAFPEDFQAEIIRGDFDPEKVEVKYVDYKAVKKRLDELASRLWNHEFSGSIKVFEINGEMSGEKSKYLSAAKHIFLNVHPEAKHEHVQQVRMILRDSGFWDDVTFGTIVLDGKALPLTFSPPLRKESSTAGKPGRGEKAEIQIGARDGRDCISFQGSLCTLAMLDRSLEKIIAMSSRDIPVVIGCTLNSSHRTLIAVLSVCAKHGMSTVSILSM